MNGIFHLDQLKVAATEDMQKQTIREMSIIGEELGLLFQIADDLLDVKGNKKNVGKPVKKDQKKGKSTLIKLLGYKKTIEFALKRKKMIIGKLKKYGKRSNKLVGTLNFILDRSY